MNRLADSTSPYLLQHADNPVDWYPWGDEAFERARAEDKPVLVSVGYSSCHWCHVMAHESFEDPATAERMNELFVNVKVDREERPDVDAVTMEATVGLTGAGGWPTTVFMTPEGKPFYAGTYFPPEPRHGMPSFRAVLDAVAAAWRERRGDVERQAARIDEALRRQPAPSREPLTAALLREAVRGIGRTFDPAHGGFGRAPKFPPASTLELLLRRGDPEALAMATATLDAMAAGGMYDVVGGGFHRYSVDERWLVPHFEKMLYDNAVLASVYLHAWVVTGAPRYRRVVEETIEYLLREMTVPGGGLASAQDADTEGVEGLTFTWTLEEADAVGLPRELLHPFEHGRHVVRGELDPALRERLLAVRARRPQPARDDKVVASWNGLALATLAEAGYRLRREDWREAARALGDVLLGPLSSEDGRLLRSLRDGRPSGPGFLDDYANVAYGLLELHVATGELRWLLEARRLALLALELFGDEEDGGFFLSERDRDPRVPRTKDLQDSPVPSGSSMLAYVLLRLARLWGDDELERRAVSAFRLVEPVLRRAPGMFAWTLVGIDLWLAPPREIAIVGSVDAPVARAALAPFQPRTAIAVGPSEEVPLLRGKGLVDGKTTVYVCERFVCQAP
ncbi:MAG: thioredoxin domain-containing protein, partial [Thermoleophilia bacterium]|nr:thioredoxin domain-containing protein [Thermoleophilia bacterium]